MIQRVEANEGTDLRGYRRQIVEEEESYDDVEEASEEPKRRGRPRKV
jgi:hypothetical protein